MAPVRHRRHIPSLRRGAAHEKKPLRPLALVDYRRPYEALAVEHEWRESEKRAHMRPRAGSSWFVGDANELGARRRTGVTGRERLRRLDEALAAMDQHIIESEKTSGRSPDQRWFHREMKKAIIPKLFRDDLDSNLDSLHREFSCTEFRREVMAITPRRYGKTWSVAMFVAAACYALEDSDQAIFSTGRRASRRLLDLVFRFLRALPGFEKSWVERNNQEEIWINVGDGSTRKISSFPSKVEVCARARALSALVCRLPPRSQVMSIFVEHSTKERTQRSAPTRSPAAAKRSRPL